MKHSRKRAELRVNVPVNLHDFVEGLSAEFSEIVRVMAESAAEIDDDLWQQEAGILRECAARLTAIEKRMDANPWMIEALA